jgi:uncharacterized membrane protein
MPSVATKIALGWAGFAGTHLVMSHPGMREKIVEKVGGEQNFLGLYSVVAFTTLAPPVFLYYRYRKTAPPYNPGQLASLLGIGISSLGALTFTQSIAAPSPTSKQEQERVAHLQGQIEAKDSEAKGIVRISRHSMFMSFALLGLGQMIIYKRAPDLAFWGGFPLFWLIGSIHQVNIFTTIH